MGKSSRAGINRINVPDEELEFQLFSMLNPVQPNPEFVTRLKTRLSVEPSIILENRNRAAAFVVLALGLFSGAFIVWVLFAIRSLLLRRLPGSRGA